MKASVPLKEVKAPEPKYRNLAPLVTLAQQGDTSAFEQLVKETERLARRVAISVVGPDQMEDVLQESYLLVYRKLVLLKNPESFVNWLARLVLHTSYNVARLEKKTDVLDPEQPSPDQTDALVDQMTMRNALERLEKKDRNIIILREMMGLSYDDIAQALRLKVGTVRSRLHAARKHLSDRLRGKTPAH